MKTIGKFMLGAMGLGLFACSSEEPVAGNAPASSEGDVFASLTLNLATRSETTGEGTSSDGIEVGTIAENNVDKILVVLASENNGTYDYLTAAYAESQRNNLASDPTYVVRFESQALAEKATEKVYIFTYCNPKANVINYFFDLEEGKYVAKESVASFQDAVLANSEGNIWGENQFLMTNAELRSNTIPTAEDLNSKYNKESTPFDLGEVPVQRVAARFDIGQKPAANGLAANTYAITDPVTGENVANVTLDAVTLFNMANDFYAFMHTSADGTATDWTLCGKDAPLKYVVSPYYSNMLTGVGSWMTDSYSFPLYAGSSITAPESYSYTSFSSLEGDDNRNDVNSFGAGYTPWRYCTPNTIPAAPNADNQANPAQIKGASTGVIFRGYITATDANAKLKAAMESGKVLYAFEGVIYGDREMLKEYVETHPESGVQRAYEAAFAGVAEGADLDSSKGGFTIYRANDNGHYYVYYYYYNHHNDNANSGVMKPMEFSVVRNNVYKLAVDNVYKFGHPGDPDDDPDPEDPDDPDETPEAYFKVSVKVLPWVVRINNIEF